MNKKLQFKSLILLVALLLGGVGSAWAEDETLQFKGTSTTNMTGGNDAALVGLNANDWSVIGDKGSNTNYPGLNKAGNIRLYYHKNGSNIITVSSLNNSTINSITVNYGSETKNKTTTHYNGGVVKVGGSTINDTNDDDDIGQYTINSTSFSIENGNNSNVQVWITSIVINYTLSAGSVATPTFSLAEGVYSSAQSVTLACTTQGATIYYTEGDEPADPTSGSTQYTGAIAVNATTTIKAIAIKGTKTSSVASATYTILPVIHAGTQEDPYTVADARNAIDAGNGLEKVYVKGIVCTGGSSLANGTMSYWISDDGTENNKLEAYKGKNLDNTNFAATTDVKVNDVVVIYGNLKKYNTTYEFDQGNYIVSLEQSKTPVINANNVTIECNATSGEIDYEISNPTTGTALTADITEGDWISNLSVSANKVTFTATANTGGQRTAKITLSYTGATDKEVTITQKKLDYATVPFTFDGNSDAIANTFGLTGIELGNYSSSPKLKFDSIKDSLILKINEAANVLTFDVKGNPPTSDPWEGTFEVKTSSDGNNYTTLASYTKLASTVQHESLILGSDVRYILWVYSTKTAGNVALGNMKVFNGEVITIPESKYTTFASTNNIDFEGTGVTVCIAKVENGAAQLAAITGNIAPANTGVILYAEEAGNYTGTIIEATDVSISENELVGVTTETAVPWTADSKYNYILQGGVFKKATGAKLHAGKAYLSTNYQAASRELKIVVEGEATAIKAVETVADKNVYDLQGRKVAAPTKGLYIINGKKMIVK